MNELEVEAWAEELQNSKMDLIELLNNHLELVKENAELKANTSIKEVHSIKQAVDHLLECDLTEENGWTKEEIQSLEKISEKDFEIRFK